MIRPRRLLTFGHSYVVSLNRRLAHEMARVDTWRWEVVAAAPTFMHGDLRPIPLESFPEEACRVEPVRAYLTKRPHIMAYGRGLRDLIRGNWDLIHCWEEPYILAATQVIRWAGRNRVVFYSFQNINKRYPPPFNWIERYTINRASGWLAAGETVRETLATRPGYSGKPHRVIPLGVDTGVFRPNRAAGAEVRAELGWADSGPLVVGYLGRFITEKGLAILIRVLSGLKTKWRALFVGGGPAENELLAFAAVFPDRVRIVTGVPHGGVPRYLNAMDVLVAPSQTTRRWREQLGRMLIEAFACGVPVIGSDSGEIPHVIGSTGLVIGETDELGWATAIGDLLDSPDRRADLATRGRDRAETEFAWPVIARRHLAFFDELFDTVRDR
jgi:glycosyltransferase involved in cell wall biosynthesis